MHTTPVTRATPGGLLFLLDHSASMLEGVGGSQRPKIQALEAAVNRCLNETLALCEKGEPEPYNYFDISLTSYTTDPKGTPIVRSAFGGGLAGREMANIPEINRHPLEVQTREKKVMGQVRPVKFKIWYKTPEASEMAGTPMCAAMEYIYRLAADWCASHRGSPAPVAIHITDGESMDGDPEPAASALRELGTGDGNLLLFNCHVSSDPSESVVFPASEAELPNEYARKLFRMSSPLTPFMVGYVRSLDLPITDGARGMVFNADSAKLILLMDTGTKIQLK